MPSAFKGGAMAERLHAMLTWMISPRTMRRREAGFTMTEMMVTVGIISIVAAIAIPTMSRDRKQNEGRKYTQEVTKLLQRVRYQAIAERQNYQVNFYSNRIEVSTYPALALVKTLRPPPGVTTIDVIAAMPSTSYLTTTATRYLIFTSLGGMVYNTTTLTTVTNSSVWTRNTNLPANHPFYQSRIDITALTGFVTSIERWN